MVQKNFETAVMPEPVFIRSKTSNSRKNPTQKRKQNVVDYKTERVSHISKFRILVRPDFDRLQYANWDGCNNLRFPEMLTVSVNGSSGRWKRSCLLLQGWDG